MGHLVTMTAAALAAFSRSACVSDGPLGFTTSHDKLNWRSMSTCINTMKRSSMVGRSPIQSIVLNCGTKSEEKKMLTILDQERVAAQMKKKLQEVEGSAVNS